MTKRKSPIKHGVKQHSRKRKPVRAYVRGSGTKTQKPIGQKKVSLPKLKKITLEREVVGVSMGVLILAESVAQARKLMRDEEFYGVNEWEVAEIEPFVGKAKPEILKYWDNQ